MSFRDFNDEGPGTFAWDYVLGHNTTGLFPDETHYCIDGDILEEIIFTYAGGETWETMINNCWEIENVSRMQDGSLTFDQEGVRFRAVVNNKFRMKYGETVFDVYEL